MRLAAPFLAISFSALAYRYKPTSFNMFNPTLAYCQAGVDYTKYPGRFSTINHIAIVKHLLSMLRDVDTDTPEFRRYSDRIMRLLIEEALSQELVVSKRKSPTGSEYDHYGINNSDFAAVSIMRGGDSMLGEVFDMIPGVGIGKVLIQRDESTKDKTPVFYYAKLPEDIASKRRVFLLDPMCATGGSAAMCIQKLVDSGVKEENITFISLITCDRGISKVMDDFPKIRMLTAAVDPVLNEQRYIIPGLGDFGDRFFGSKLPK